VVLMLTQPLIDFVVTTVWEELDIERLHRSAGFEPVPREVVMRRFVTFVEFLRASGLTTRTVVENTSLVHEYSELCRSDLTGEGFAFVRAVHGKWLNRMGRDMRDTRERELLGGWLAQFRAWTAARAS
jgi:hypothetical protein